MALPQTIDSQRPLDNATDILMAANTVLSRMTPVAPKPVSGVNGGVAQATGFRRAVGARGIAGHAIRHEFKAVAKPPSMRRYPRASNILMAQSEAESAYRYVSLIPQRTSRIRHGFTHIARHSPRPVFRRGVKPLPLSMQRIYQALARQDALRSFEYNDMLDYMRDRMHATIIRDTLLKRFQENRMDLADKRIDLPRLAVARARGYAPQRFVYS